MFQISQIPTKPTKPMEILQEPANTLQISYGYPTLPSENSYKNYKLQNPTEILCTPCRTPHQPRFYLSLNTELLTKAYQKPMDTILEPA